MQPRHALVFSSLSVPVSVHLSASLAQRDVAIPPTRAVHERPKLCENEGLALTGRESACVDLGLAVARVPSSSSPFESRGGTTSRAHRAIACSMQFAYGIDMELAALLKLHPCRSAARVSAFRIRFSKTEWPGRIPFRSLREWSATGVKTCVVRMCLRIEPGE
jgi:hypothetical protein